MADTDDDVQSPVSASDWYNLVISAPDIEQRNEQVLLCLQSILRESGRAAIEDLHTVDNIRYELSQYEPSQATDEITSLRSELTADGLISYIQTHYCDTTQRTLDSQGLPTPHLQPAAETTIPIIVRTEGELSITQYGVFHDLHVVVEVDELRYQGPMEGDEE